MAPTGDVTSELLDLDRLTSWLDRQGLEPGAPVLAEAMTGGASNVMLRIERGPARWVLRRPAKVALDRADEGMRREFRFLGAFEGTPVPHPSPVALCDDHEVTHAGPPGAGRGERAERGCDRGSRRLQCREEGRRHPGERGDGEAERHRPAIDVAVELHRNWQRKGRDPAGEPRRDEHAAGNEWQSLRVTATLRTSGATDVNVR